MVFPDLRASAIVLKRQTQKNEVHLVKLLSPIMFIHAKENRVSVQFIATNVVWLKIQKSLVFFVLVNLCRKSVERDIYPGSILYRSLSVFFFSSTNCLVFSATNSSKLLAYFSIILSMLSIIL